MSRKQPSSTSDTPRVTASTGAAREKWTPGPLEVAMEEWMPGDDLAIVSDGAPVAEVYGYDAFPCFDPSDEEAVEVFNARQRADALRFASTPDLYEACAAIVSCAGKDSLSFETARKLARAALAKARGENA